MKITRRQLRHMILREVRRINEGAGEPLLQLPGKHGEVIKIIYKILHFDDDTNTGPKMLGMGGYDIEEFKPGRYDDMDGICLITGMNNIRESEHVVKILKNDGRLDKYMDGLYIEPQEDRVFVAFGIPFEKFPRD